VTRASQVVLTRLFLKQRRVARGENHQVIRSHGQRSASSLSLAHSQLALDGLSHPVTQSRRRVVNRQSQHSDRTPSRRQPRQPSRCPCARPSVARSPCTLTLGGPLVITLEPPNLCMGTARAPVVCANVLASAKTVDYCGRWVTKTACLQNRPRVLVDATTLACDREQISASAAVARASKGEELGPWLRWPDRHELGTVIQPVSLQIVINLFCEWSMAENNFDFGALVALLLLVVAPACAACANAPASYASSWRPSNPRRCTHERQISPLNPVSHVQVLQEEAATGNLSWHGEHNNQSPPPTMHQ
jgi:hypothetical protein